jgi:hypothetical protein
MAEKKNKSAFAKYCGVAPAAITRAVREGRVETTEDGKFVDMASDVTLQFVRKQLTKPEKVPQKPPEATKKKPTPEPPKPKKPRGRPPAKRKVHGNSKEVSDMEGGEESGAVSKNRVEIRRIQAQTTKMNMDIAENAGRLILREKVSGFFARLATLATNLILPMGQRVASDIGDLCGVTDPKVLLKIQDIIDKENERVLQGFKAVAEDAAKGD